ncbi:hypothetical protein EBX31_03260 [bacterium]|nr:hypothetical protein [bacterium]
MATDLKTRLVQAIRNWVHANNYAETHQRQALNFRKERAGHEAESIALMKQMGLTGSVIQISGAKLQIGRRAAPAGLTWGYLEREIGAWAAHNGMPAATTAGLVKWLHDHREVKEVEYLKRSDEGAGAA